MQYQVASEDTMFTVSPPQTNTAEAPNPALYLSPFSCHCHMPNLNQPSCKVVQHTSETECDLLGRTILRQKAAKAKREAELQEMQAESAPKEAETKAQLAGNEEDGATKELKKTKAESASLQAGL